MLTIGTNGTKTFNIIPRKDATSVNVSLTSETTGTEYTDTTSLSQNKYYYNMACDFETTLKESSFYVLEVKEGSNTIFKDKVFCTDQSINNFSVNYNTYVEHSSDNEFIII
jgi:hypothetical protein